MVVPNAGGSLAIQEFKIAPDGAQGFAGAMRMGSEIYHYLKVLAKEQYEASAGNVGDEGGIAPDIGSAEDALDMIATAINACGYEGRVKIGIDSALAVFFNDGKYDSNFKNPSFDPCKWLSAAQLAEYYRSLLKKYPLISFKTLMLKTIGLHGLLSLRLPMFRLSQMTSRAPIGLGSPVL